jgi:hypothetical protein
MRHGKGPYMELSHGERLTDFDISSHIVGHLPRDTVVVVNASVYGLRGIDRNLIFITESPHRLDMIGMIVGNQQVLYGLQLNAIVLAVLLQGAYANAYIYHQSVCGSTKVIAITAAATSKRYKSQHVCLYFRAKVQ